MSYCRVPCIKAIKSLDYGTYRIQLMTITQTHSIMEGTQALRSYQVVSTGLTRSDSQIIDGATGEVLYSTDASYRRLSLVQGGNNKTGAAMGSAQFPWMSSRIRFTLPDGAGGVWEEEMQRSKWQGSYKHKVFSVPTPNGMRNFEWKGTSNVSRFKDRNGAGGHSTSPYNLKLIDPTTQAVLAVYLGSGALSRGGRFEILQDPRVGPQGDVLIILTGLALCERIRKQLAAAAAG
jgi:hypothetical protein